ncbi:MAG: DUF4835 family protein [Salinivirgaceae bacterium]
MHRNFKIILFLTISISFGFVTPKSTAQELNARIQVNSSQIQGTNKTVYEELQKGLFEFLNNRNWTNHTYAVEERIEVNFMLNITKQLSVDEFEGTLQVNSSRPVYNSGYATPLLVFLDKNVKFRYAEGQALEFSETSHDELTALFAYYVYLVIGFDYDSFSPLGGTEFFRIAEKIVSNAQASTSAGWKQYENRKNRYWLVENLLNQVYSPVRDFYYTYHRQALDLMHKSPADSRTKIVEGLVELQKVHRAKPSSFIMQIVFDAKRDELINLLRESPTAEATRALNYLKELDPANANRYQKIVNKG